MSLTKREQYIKEIFLPKNKSSKKTYLSEDKVDVLVKKISDMGERFGFVGNEVSQSREKNEKRKHKYDVWIAKEIKKDINRNAPLDLINRFTDFQGIFDWVSEKQEDLFSYNFESAYKLQEEWHNMMFSELEIENIEIPEVDNERIIFRCSDGEHFFYLLNDKELDYEGDFMGHCVGGKNYKNKVRNNEALIVSIRDHENKPHVTIEVNTSSANVIQEYGKKNNSVNQKYGKLINEFALFASEFDGLEKREALKFLNLNFF